MIHVGLSQTYTVHVSHAHLFQHTHSCSRTRTPPVLFHRTFLRTIYIRPFLQNWVRLVSLSQRNLFCNCSSTQVMTSKMRSGGNGNGSRTRPPHNDRGIRTIPRTLLGGMPHFAMSAKIDVTNCTCSWSPNTYCLCILFIFCYSTL